MADAPELTLNEFSKLTTTMFSAAIGQVSWEYFLSELSASSGDICTHIFGFDTEANINLDLKVSGYDSHFASAFEDYYGAINPWAPGFAEHDAGVVVDSEDMCTTENLVKTEFYNDWVRPQEDICQGGGALLFKNDNRVVAMGGNIRLRDADVLKPKWLRLMRILVPHMQQAFEFSRALAGSKLETFLVGKHSLHEVPAIVLLSEMGRVLYANSIAQHMISAGFPISTTLNGDLSFGSGQISQRINHDLLRKNINSAKPSFSVKVPSPILGDSYCLRFAKFTPDAQIPLPLVSTLSISSPCVLLIATKMRTLFDLTQEMQSCYGLTLAEAEVAIALYEGSNSREISEHRSVSIHTVRHQIKSAMSKVDARRQVELVSVIHKIAHSHSSFRG